MSEQPIDNLDVLAAFNKMSPDEQKRWVEYQNGVNDIQSAVKGMAVRHAIGCGVHTQADAPPMVKCAHACPKDLDPKHHEGLVLTKECWMLCKTCFRLHHAKKMRTKELMVNCGSCILEYARRVVVNNPTKFLNLGPVAFDMGQLPGKNFDGL